MILHSIVLGVIQGLTEFIPVSSSGHLILIPKLLNWADQGLAYDATIHLGTILAVLIYFRKDLIDVVKNLSARRDSLGYQIALASIPAVISGMFLKDFIAGQTRTIEFVSSNLIFWGIFMIIAEYYSRNVKPKKKLEELTLKNVLLIGLAQSIALIPGTSRSGVTILAGIFQDISREAAIRFSFLLSIPVIAGAGFLSFLDMQSATITPDYASLAVALAFSFLSGLLAIHFMLRFVTKQGLHYFGVYRILLGGLLLLLF